MNLKECNIGVIGLGQMGGGIASNLIQAGYSVLGYDIKPEAITRLKEVGLKGAESSKEIVESCEVVLTCVEGHDSIELADTVLVPNASLGQIFIDHSTVPPPQTRRIGHRFIKKGAKYLDAPISGGKHGAENGILRVFVGGEKSTAEQCWELFETIGNPDKVVYCGSIGMGQDAKIVQQLTKRFPDVARMEVMCFGLRSGLDLDTVMRALDVSPESKEPYARLYSAIKNNNTDNLSGLFSEWEYYLEEVRAKGFRMPMLEAMYEFCKDAEKVSFDAVGRPEPSIWNELMKYSEEQEE